MWCWVIPAVISPTRVRAVCCETFALHWLKSITTVTEEPAPLLQEGRCTACRATPDANSLPLPHTPPPPPQLTTPNSPEAGVSVASYTVEKAEAETVKCVSIYFGPSDRETGESRGHVAAEGARPLFKGLSLWAP